MQLPPSFSLRHDESALRDFLHALPIGWPFAVEFRRREWHVPRIVHLLTELRIAWVWSDLTALAEQAEGALEFAPETADFAYIRLMGDLDTKYRGDVSTTHTYRVLLWPRDTSLDNWAARIRESLTRLRRVVVMANNHFEGFAPLTCARLGERLGLSLPLPSARELREDDDSSAQMELL